MALLAQLRDKLVKGTKFRTNASGFGTLSSFYESEVLCDRHTDNIYVRAPEGKKGFKCHHLKDTDTSLALNISNTEAEVELI